MPSPSFNSPRKLNAFIGLASALGLSYSPVSSAVLTDNLTLGNPKALSLANAVTADPPGIDSVHFNPAGISALKGRQAELKVAASTFNVKLRFKDYSPERQAWLDARTNDALYPNGYFADVAHNASSDTSGASLVLPGLGMTDLPFMVGPMGGVSYSPENSRFSFATDIYTPLAAGFYRSDDDPGRFIGQRLAFTLLTYFSPTVAYQFSDTFSAGATLTFNYSGSGLEMPFRSGGDSVDQLARINFSQCQSNPGNAVCSQQVGLYDELGVLSMEAENSLSFGFNAGVLWKLSNWLSVGAVYQSSTPMHMEGDFVWKNSETWNNFYAPLLVQLGQLESGSTNQSTVRGKAKLNMQLPEHYAIGFSFMLNPQWKINVDFKHTAWSQWEGIPVEFSKPIDFLRLAELVQPDAVSENQLTFPFALKDSWNQALGLIFQYSKQLELRFGVENRPSSIPKASQSPLLPIGDGVLFGAGFGLKRASGATLDVAIGHFASTQNMPGGSSILGNSNDPKRVIYSPYPGTDIKTHLDFNLLEVGYRFAF